ncbi:MAG TPA: LamG-like jellyroll fold domain-containing protein, partial [Verrucomicrobiae bacterium]|nr:LamG-like jellyroll fold domain-containing protein [Verrucomicrobiae bacterium]
EDPPVGETYNGRTTLFITPSNGGVMRFNYTQAAGGAVGVIDSTPLGANQDFHIVVVFDPKQGITRMYRNGVFAGIGTLPENVGTNLRDDTSILDVNVWLGRSNFGADPYYNGRITEFRIWRGGMTEAQARQNYNCGPDNPNGCTIPAAPTIGLNQTGGAATIAWPASAYGYNMHTTTTLGEGSTWTPAAAQPLTTQGVRRFNVNPTGGAAFFQLQTDE